MPLLTASTVNTVPLAAPVKIRGQYKSQNKQTSCGPVKVSMQFQPFDAQRGHNTITVSGPVGLATRLPTIDGGRPFMHSKEKWPGSVTHSAARNVRCAASGQTQTLNRDKKTISKLPVRDVDVGGPGFPPRHDGGGGGGGGGGGNSSGGFVLFGFLLFLNFLKDIEDGYQESRRR